MANHIILSEKQYHKFKQLLEGVRIDVDPSSTNGDMNAALRNSKQEAEKHGLKSGDVEYIVTGNDMQESKLISLSQLKENRLKVLKENSEVYSVKEFMKKIRK